MYAPTHLCCHTSGRKTQVVVKKGAVSTDLGFLISGELTVLSNIDSRTPKVYLRPSEKGILSPNGAEEILVLPSEGCYGQGVFTGRRRTHTIVARKHVSSTRCIPSVSCDGAAL